MKTLAHALSAIAMMMTSATAEADDAGGSSRKASSIDLVATAFAGDGLRFNNPYRLASVLGSTAESLSRTAGYVDLGGAVLAGDPTKIAQGLALRVSIAVEGVPQAVATPSYLLLHRSGPWAAYGRAGVGLVVSPDVTWGLEGGAGGIWFARAGIGVAAELVGDVFYGAGTREVARPAYPVLSAQAGLWLSWEALL